MIRACGRAHPEAIRPHQVPTASSQADGRKIAEGLTPPASIRRDHSGEPRSVRPARLHCHVRGPAPPASASRRRTPRRRRSRMQAGPAPIIGVRGQGRGRSRKVAESWGRLGKVAARARLLNEWHHASGTHQARIRHSSRLAKPFRYVRRDARPLANVSPRAPRECQSSHRFATPRSTAPSCTSSRPLRTSPSTRALGASVSLPRVVMTAPPPLSPTVPHT